MPSAISTPRWSSQHRLVDTSGFDDTFLSDVQISRRIVHWLNLIVLDASARTFKVGDCAGNTPRTFSSFGDRHATDQCVIDHEKEATLLPDIHALVSEFARISPKGHLKNDVSFNRQTSVLFLPAQTRYGCCMRFLQCVQSPIHVAYS